MKPFGFLSEEATMAIPVSMVVSYPTGGEKIQIVFTPPPVTTGTISVVISDNYSDGVHCPGTSNSSGAGVLTATWTSGNTVVFDFQGMMNFALTPLPTSSSFFALGAGTTVWPQPYYLPAKVRVANATS